MQPLRTAARLLSPRPVAVAAGLVAVAALFLAVWRLLLPHFGTLGGVYRLAASRPSADPPGAAAIWATLGACAAAFLGGLLFERRRGRRRTVR